MLFTTFAKAAKSEKYTDFTKYVVLATMSPARSANAKIVMSQQRNVPKKAASAVLLIGKATRTVMITTITARAIGMAEIAVVSSSLCCGCLHGHSCWLAPPPLVN